MSYTLEGKAGIEKIQSAMAQLRVNPPAVIGGRDVVKFVDYNDSAATDLPKSNVLRWTLSDCSWAIARPSGTEPKLKIYSAAATPPVMPTLSSPPWPLKWTIC